MTVDDEGAPCHHGKHWAETDLTFCLKRQLDAAQQRIKRLEEAGDNMAAYIASGIDVNEWRKAKEAKP